jgi:hypothetical protein
MAKLRKEGKAEVTLKKKKWVLDMANCDFGDRPITEISAADILATLRKVGVEGHFRNRQASTRDHRTSLSLCHRNSTGGQ